MSCSAVCALESLQDTMARTCGSALTYLNHAWKDEKNSSLFQVEGKPAPDDGKSRAAAEGIKGPDVPLTTLLAERFACLFFLSFVVSVLHRVRSLILTIGGLYVFLLLSLTSYPLEPRTPIRAFLLLMFLVTVGVVGMVYGSIHQNPTLSYVTDTEPGKLDFEYWLRMGSFVLIPLLGLLTSLFPAVNSFFFSWMQPALSSVK
jgi:hypothetical protein